MFVFPGVNISSVLSSAFSGILKDATGTGMTVPPIGAPTNDGLLKKAMNMMGSAGKWAGPQPKSALPTFAPPKIQPIQQISVRKI